MDATLAGRGFRKTEPDRADVRIVYRFEIRQKIQSEDVRTGFGFGYGTYGRYGGITIGTGSDVTTYDEGLLVLDMLAPDSGELLWRGNATFRMPAHPKPEKTTALISEAVEKVLAQFPPE